MDTVLARYLLRYRNTPHSTTGESPTMLLIGRRLRTRLDLLTPSVHKHVEAKPHAVVEQTSDRQLRNLQVGNQLWPETTWKEESEKWMQGIVTQVLGSRHYMVNIQGQLWKRHIDQLIRSSVNEQSGRLTSFPVNDPAGIESESVSGSPVTSALPDTDMSLQNSKSHNLPQFASNASQEQQEFVAELQVSDLQKGIQAAGIPGMSLSTQPDRRYPTRVRTAPSYLKDYEH